MPKRKKPHSTTVVHHNIQPVPAKHFLPQWRGPVEGYAVNSVRRVLPRLIKYHDFEDLFHESFHVYLSVKARYAPPVDNGAWFMALYKRCLAMRFADLAARAMRYAPEVATDELPESAAIDWHDGYLMLALRQLPRELVETLKMIASAPSELVDALGTRTVSTARARAETLLRQEE